MTSAIEILKINKSFGKVRALKNINVKIEENEIVALIGPSGSGKSTLLRHIAGLELSDKNSDGEILINAENIQKNGRLSRSSRKIRSQVGVIFQQFNLVNRLSTLTNVLLGSLGSISIVRGTLGLFTQSEKEAALQALERVGLKDVAYQRTSTLSGGQQQRVAIARSLMQQARIIIADEPIASLDPRSAKTVMKHLRRLQKQDGKTVIITLHQVEYARKYCKRVIALVSGEIVFDGKAKELTDDVLIRLYGTSMIDDEDEEDDDHCLAVQNQVAIPQAVLLNGISG